MERYARQNELVNQEKLKKSSVLIGGVGGLGGFSSLYLALAGVGTLILVDNDIVEESNLNRQVLYREEDIGMPKVKIASKRLREINPDTNIIPLQMDVKEDMEIPYEVDVVIDGMDNLEGRLSLESFAMKRGIPFIFGAVEGYMGMVSFIDNSTKKLEDFIHRFKSEKPQVLGATAGLIASIQALEAIKYISGKGDLLKNKILLYDALSTNFLEVSL